MSCPYLILTAILKLAHQRSAQIAIGTGARPKRLGLRKILCSVILGSNLRSKL